MTEWHAFFRFIPETEQWHVVITKPDRSGELGVQEVVDAMLAKSRAEADDFVRGYLGPTKTIYEAPPTLTDQGDCS